MAKAGKRKSRKPGRKVVKREVTRRICNLVPSKGTETDWSFRDAVASGALGAVAAPPASMDLRAAWWAIDDQEDTGSCVGWATAEGVVRYHMVTAGKLTKKEQLSPRFVWMGSKETDEFTTRPEGFIEEAGTSLKAAMDIVRKSGAVTMALLPFQIATRMYGGDENTFYAAAAQRKIAAYFNLDTPSQSSATRRPVGSSFATAGEPAGATTDLDTCPRRTSRQGSSTSRTARRYKNA